MPTYADVDDLRNAYEGDIPESLEGKLTTKLDDAEEIVSSFVVNSDIGAHIAAGRTNANRVRIVLCNMVLRVLRNPSGAHTQSAGPFSQTLDKAVASGKLFLTRDDRRLLGLRRGATSVEMTDEALPLLPRSPHARCVERSNAETCEDYP